ncbi:Uu.00g045870.m01.CDS01 [Anthostomella pinea]|uniref:Uu.00g045870.m01.CDS01 n=1 Tax=Anthostomella pinea TaxID=933095 RepID=A0AAI8YC17_9PEZI|nr:Uu.00g045870.m01.CDS01 [Anthostomella pinea]
MRRHINASWDINAKLAQLFDKPIAFRAKLAQCNALIAGSFALQFFERVHWAESDLDIEVQVGANLDAMHDFLINEAGYQFSLNNKERGSLAKPQDTARPVTEYVYTGTGGKYGTRDVVECRTYYQERGTTIVKAQLIATKDIPVQGILRCYYTTCIVNFITWNKAYSLFPIATFVDHETIPLKRLNNQEKRYHEKYRPRGWTMKASPPQVLETGFVTTVRASSGQRRVGDRHTWAIPLDTAGVTPAPTPDYVIESSCFEVYTTTTSRRSSSKINADIFASPGLQYM